jgi:hypothetical protein
MIRIFKIIFFLMIFGVSVCAKGSDKNQDIVLKDIIEALEQICEYYDSSEIYYTTQRKEHPQVSSKESYSIPMNGSRNLIRGCKDGYYLEYEKTDFSDKKNTVGYIKESFRSTAEYSLKYDEYPTDNNTLVQRAVLSRNLSGMSMPSLFAGLRQRVMVDTTADTFRWKLPKLSEMIGKEEYKLNSIKKAPDGKNLIELVYKPSDKISTRHVILDERYFYAPVNYRRYVELDTGRELVREINYTWKANPSKKIPELLEIKEITEDSAFVNDTTVRYSLELTSTVTKINKVDCNHVPWIEDLPKGVTVVDETNNTISKNDYDAKEINRSENKQELDSLTKNISIIEKNNALQDYCLLLAVLATIVIFVIILKKLKNKK